MNRVYLARDVSNQQEVVLKFTNDDLIGNIAVFERYKRKAEIGNRLHHPQVEHQLNTDEKRSEEYLVVENIKGRTLRTLLKEHANHPLPVVEAKRITLQICDALAYCHEQGVFHREGMGVRDLPVPHGRSVIESGSSKLSTCCFKRGRW
jgi:serine/threonine protein kinase